MKAVRSLLLATLGGALVVSLAGFSPGTAATGRAASPSAGAATQTWLDRVNQVRVASGLPAVAENLAWTDGIRKHLVYLENTPASLMTGTYASAHTENPASPYYTAEGALEAGRSNLGGGVTDLDAIDGWLVAPFHAIGILRRGLTQVAFARSERGTAGLDVLGGVTSTPAPTTPVLFPGAGSTIDLSRLDVRENPDPTETCSLTKGLTGWGGLPLIAMLPAAPDPAITATLTLPDGSVLGSDGPGLCLVDENHFQTTDTFYGPTGRAILQDEHAVLLLPRAALVRGTFTATIRQPGQPDLSWSFVSAPKGLAPDVTVGSKRCSYTGTSSGQVLVTITNPNDGAGASTYSLEGAGTPVTTAALGDGQTVKVVLGGLPVGDIEFLVAGSDGGIGTGSSEVPACPAYQGVVAKLGRVDKARHRAKVVLKNPYNGSAVRFALRVSGQDPKKVLVASGSKKAVWVRLRHDQRTKVAIRVGGHVVLVKVIKL